MLALAQGGILGRVTGAIALVSRVHPLPRDAAIADRRIFCLPCDRACLLGVVDLGNLHAHDPLIEDRGDQIREGFVDTHDWRDVGGLKPPGEIRDRFEVEGAVFVVDHAVVEAGGRDDPRHAARRRLSFALEPGAKRGPPSYAPRRRMLFSLSWIVPGSHCEAQNVTGASVRRLAFHHASHLVLHQPRVETASSR